MSGNFRRFLEGENMKIKCINFPVNEKLHADLKGLAVKRGETIKDIVTALIEEFIKKNGR